MRRLRLLRASSSHQHVVPQRRQIAGDLPLRQAVLLQRLLAAPPAATAAVGAGRADSGRLQALPAAEGMVDHIPEACHQARSAGLHEAAAESRAAAVLQPLRDQRRQRSPLAVDRLSRNSNTLICG